MSLQTGTGPESEQTSQAYELVADVVVIFEVVLEAPLVAKCAETQIAERFVTHRVVDMVLQAISIFEDSLAEVAVVFVVRRLLDVCEERRLGGQLFRADPTPVLVRIGCLVAATGR